MSEFVHLHVHSQYSMLDSALRLDGMVKRAKALGMPALALTDHGNMFGALQFHKACKDAGVAPILGCEVNLCADHRETKGRDSTHLVLLARSQDGYRSLIQLVSKGWVEGLVHGKPRVDFEQLYEHRNGLVGLSACMGGYVAQQVLQKGRDAGRDALAKLRDCLEPDALYVELQDHGFIEQKPLNQVLVSLARELSLPLVASNDCHYLEQQHAHAQMVLQCISAGVAVQDMKRSHHGSEQLYFKSGDEMAALFAELPEAIANTRLIAEMCGGAANPNNKPMLPRFHVPEGMDEATYFRQVARQGLDRRFDELQLIGQHVDREAYRKRLEMEADVIANMGFPGYFLIVHDFINWAKEHGIPVGPGRGSGAGSLVAYAMRITDLDPIFHGLLFERFLNPERVSMPDFDIDFCMDRRDEVINYVRSKYGANSVGQIATFHLLKSRSVVRDVGRVMGMTPQDAGRIAGLVPEPVQGKVVPIAEAMEQEKRLKQAYDEEGQVRELLDTAMSLENLNRHAGMHAAGVVISDGPLWTHVPVFCPEENVYVTQYHMTDVEAAGLVKFDFLGLKTLTTLQIACELINKRPDRWVDGKHDPFHLERIAMDDATTYALLQTGETTGVFQFESSGMQALIKRMRPDSFEDVVALCALYRPGPLGSGMVDDYVEGKHKRKAVAYPHPCLENVLKDTFGVMVYQEQVMQAAREMAGYSLGGADLLRRAMGKKKPEEMAKQKLTFIDGARKNGHSMDDAERVFELMSYFSGYGFNKSHSAAYALVAYQCAYLKAHYPVEFLCATMTADKDKIDKVVRTVAEARDMGITVLPPDVNESEISFTVVYDPKPDSPKRPVGKPVALGGTLRDPMSPRIRFGLGAVKGVGSAALEAIFDGRALMADGVTPASNGASSSTAPSASNKESAQAPAPAGPAGPVGPVGKEPFLDLFDFTARVDLRRVNKAVVEALVLCGAFDSLHEPRGIHRAQALAAADAAIERGKVVSADRASGQTDLFGMLAPDPEPRSPAAAGTAARGTAGFPATPPWERKEKLRREKATLGFYLSGHPLDGYREELKRFCKHTTISISGLPDKSQVTLGGVIEDLRVRPMRSGGKVGFFQLEDPFGRVEVIVRDKALEAYRDLLQVDAEVLVTGAVREERDQNGDPESDQPAEVKLVLDSVSKLGESLRARTRSVRVRMNVERIDRQKLLELRRTLEDFPGNCPVSLQLFSAGSWHVTMGAKKLSVDPSEQMLAQLERLFGEKVCELR